MKAALRGAKAKGVPEGKASENSVFLQVGCRGVEGTWIANVSISCPLVVTRWGAAQRLRLGDRKRQLNKVRTKSRIGRGQMTHQECT